MSAADPATQLIVEHAASTEVLDIVAALDDEAAQR